MSAAARSATMDPPYRTAVPQRGGGTGRPRRRGRPGRQRRLRTDAGDGARGGSICVPHITPSERRARRPRTVTTAPSPTCGLRGSLQRIGYQASALHHRPPRATAARDRASHLRGDPGDARHVAQWVVFPAETIDEVTEFMKALTDPRRATWRTSRRPECRAGCRSTADSRRSAAGAGLLGALGAFVGRQQPPALRRNLPRRRDRLGDRFAPGRRGQGEPGGLAVAGRQWRRACPSDRKTAPPNSPSGRAPRHHLPLGFFTPGLRLHRRSGELLGARPRSTRRAGPSSWPTFIRAFPSAAPSFSCSPSCRSAASPRTNCSTRSRPRACYRRDSDTDVPPACRPFRLRLFRGGERSVACAGGRLLVPGGFFERLPADLLVDLAMRIPSACQADQP